MSRVLSSLHWELHQITRTVPFKKTYAGLPTKDDTSETTAEISLNIAEISLNISEISLNIAEISLNIAESRAIFCNCELFLYIINS